MDQRRQFFLDQTIAYGDQLWSQVTYLLSLGHVLGRDDLPRRISLCKRNSCLSACQLRYDVIGLIH